jgi:response regulator RpfG family c-di-GMP phosphodiesterase
MKQVLIADDEPEIRSVLVRALGLLGYRVDQAVNGSEAIEKASETKYSLIMLDHFMPEVAGLDALAAIRDDGPNMSSPVIMVTAYGDMDTVRSAMELGANDFVVKPFHTAILMSKIEKWVSAGAEMAWKNLKPDQEEALRLSLETMTTIFQAVRDRGEIPYQRMKSTSEQIVTVMETGQIAGVLHALKEHDNYTFAHSLRVGVYLAHFAQNLARLSHAETVTVTMGGMIHDVGKAKVPLAILNKPEALTPEEFDIVKRHVEHTVDVLGENAHLPQTVIDIGRDHHERMDGSGYPRGLKGLDIDMFARMAAVVDSYVAITDRRVYKPAYPPEEAFKILYQRREQYDEAILAFFRTMILDDPLETVKKVPPTTNFGA